MKNYANIAWVWFKRKTMLTYFVTVFLVATVYLWGPYVEVSAFPILTGIRVTQVHIMTDADGDKKNCFAIAFKKERYAVPKYVVFLAVTPSGEQYDTRVMVGENGKERPFLTYTNKPVRATGTVGTYFWCVQIPPDIDGLTLAGKIQYSTWHHQWDLDQTLPTITVPNSGDRPETNYDEESWTKTRSNPAYKDLETRKD